MACSKTDWLRESFIPPVHSNTCEHKCHVSHTLSSSYMDNNKENMLVCFIESSKMLTVINMWPATGRWPVKGYTKSAGTGSSSCVTLVRTSARRISSLLILVTGKKKKKKDSNCIYRLHTISSLHFFPHWLQTAQTSKSFETSPDTSWQAMTVMAWCKLPELEFMHNQSTENNTEKGIDFFFQAFSLIASETKHVMHIIQYAEGCTHVTKKYTVYKLARNDIAAWGRR